jgi:hypothetical protein
MSCSADDDGDDGRRLIQLKSDTYDFLRHFHYHVVPMKILPLRGGERRHRKMEETA